LRFAKIFVGAMSIRRHPVRREGDKDARRGRIGGAWKITRQHTSVPFRMDGSVKAAVDLKP